MSNYDQSPEDYGTRTLKPEVLFPPNLPKKQIVYFDTLSVEYAAGSAEMVIGTEQEDITLNAIQIAELKTALRILGLDNPEDGVTCR